MQNKFEIYPAIRSNLVFSITTQSFSNLSLITHEVCIYRVYLVSIDDREYASYEVTFFCKNIYIKSRLKSIPIGRIKYPNNQNLMI